MPDVTGITALDVGIGLAFVYVLFSVLCSAVQEAIASILDLRSATLVDGLKNLLDDDGDAGSRGAPSQVKPVPPAPAARGNVPDLTKELLGHGLIRTQYKRSTVLFWGKRGHRRGPSYIAPRTFAVALLDQLERNSTDQNSTSSIATKIEAANIPAGTKHALLALAREAGTSRAHLTKLVEDWFDAGMDRVSGWYKRRAQIIVCVLSLAVTVGLNVNTIGIADRLTRDDSLRAAVVEQATTSTSKQGDSLNKVADDIGKVRKLGLPIGWSKGVGDPVRADLGRHFWRTAGGWLITFLMLSLGAPFWFDALGRLVAVRGSGTKPKPGESTVTPATG